MAVVCCYASFFGVPRRCLTCNDDDDDDDDNQADDDSTNGGTNDDLSDDDTGEMPAYPNKRMAMWDCYLCRDASWKGAPVEPCGGVYTAPGECIGCHQQGGWSNAPSGPDGHFPTADCLTCHGKKHGKTWDDENQ